MGKRNALYLLRDDASDIGTVVVVWDQEDYLREANSQLSDKDVYREVKGDAEGPIRKFIKSILGKITNRCDVSDETLDYFLVNNPKLGRFYLLPKIYKRLHNALDRPVVSNSSYLLRIFLPFLISVWNHWHKKWNSIFKIRIIFWKKNHILMKKGW